MKLYMKATTKNAKPNNMNSKNLCNQSILINGNLNVNFVAKNHWKKISCVKKRPSFKEINAYVIQNIMQNNNSK